MALVIPEGSSFTSVSSGIVISKDITSVLVWGGGSEILPDDQKPTLRVAQWDVEGDLTDIEFYNVHVTCNNSYTFRLGQNATVGHIGSIKFTSCYISDMVAETSLSGGGGLVVIRDSGASEATIDNIIIDDCLIQNVGNYSLIHSESGGSTAVISNITMTNTTAYNFTRCVIRLDQTATVNLNIDQCTFYNTNASNNSSGYFFRLANAASPTVTMTNTLIGKGYLATSPSGLSITSENVYYTNDGSGTPSWATSTNGSSEELFSNPSGGDFTVVNSSYAAYGDSRWR